LHLRAAIDYCAREAICRAASLSSGPVTRDQFALLLGQAIHSNSPVPDVDLLIRTGGEQRLSDFMLWECAYAELFFTDCKWPDFGCDDLAAAIAEFLSRERRFGGVPIKAVGN